MVAISDLKRLDLKKESTPAVLAKRLGCNFVTADKKLYEKLKKFSRVVLL